MERRTFLTATGLSVLGLATRLSPLTVGSPSPKSVVRKHYQRAEETDTGEFRRFADEVEELSHTASPLPGIVHGHPSFLSEAKQRGISETAVVAENIDPTWFADDSTFLQGSLTDADVEAIATENAVVGATIEYDHLEETATQEWLVATEDDEWRLVRF